MALSAKNKKDADTYFYFSFDNKGGIGGIANGVKFGGGKGSGSFCLGKNYKKERTAISEWMTSDAKSSLVRLISSCMLYLYLLKHFKSNPPLNKCLSFFRYFRMSLVTPLECLMTSVLIKHANGLQQGILQGLINLVRHVGAKIA